TQGNGVFSFFADGVFPGRYFTATATDLDTGETSEFSLAFLNSREIAELSIDNIVVSEGNAGTVAAVFTVSLSTPVGSPVGVNWQTASGSALAGLDFIPTNGTLSFAPGEKSKPIAVVVLADPAPEPEETFFVNLSNPVNARLGSSQGKATLVELWIASLAR